MIMSMLIIGLSKPTMQVILNSLCMIEVMCVLINGLSPPN